MYANNISSSAVNVAWEALDESTYEGPFQGYVIFFRLTDTHLICTFYDNCTHLNSTTTNATTTEINLVHLDLHSNYSVWVAAFTEAGIGPESEITMVMTDTYGRILFVKLMFFFFF